MLDGIPHKIVGVKLHHFKDTDFRIFCMNIGVGLNEVCVQLLKKKIYTDDFRFVNATFICYFLEYKFLFVLRYYCIKHREIEGFDVVYSKKY